MFALAPVDSGDVEADDVLLPWRTALEFPWLKRVGTLEDRTWRKLSTNTERAELAYQSIAVTAHFGRV